MKNTCMMIPSIYNTHMRMYANISMNGFGCNTIYTIKIKTANERVRASETKNERKSVYGNGECSVELARNIQM